MRLVENADQNTQGKKNNNNNNNNSYLKKKIIHQFLYKSDHKSN